ncbi:MAG: uroporphyrinogen-III C-methyltransferase [Chitinophagaceae bacterium]
MAANKGKVIIAGAGPGDTELITIKLLRRLEEADVIITDRLVNPEIISSYAKKEAIIILAAKQGYNDASVSQLEINQLIIEYSLAGKIVLRLKGGDVAFFSNVRDELDCIVEAGIEFEIIPGITAAAGASAYAGIPLTARGVSQGVQFLTFNPNSYYSTEKWKGLANTHDTLVFYMAAKNVTGLAEILLRYNSKAVTSLAVIEQATTVHQQVHITTLQNCADDFATKQFSSPSLVIVGEVVKLHKQFDWFNTRKETGSIFNELAIK